MRRRSLAALAAAVVAVAALAGCTPVPAPAHTIAVSPTDASSSVPVALVDPQVSGAKPPGAVLLSDVQGTGTRTLSIAGAAGASKLVVAVVCGGAGSPLTVHSATGGLLLGVAGCDAVAPRAVYSSESALRGSSRTISLSAATATRWRIAIWKVPAGS